MTILFPYLINRAVFRIREFFRHWYVNGFFVYSHFIFSLLERIDRVLAFKITLRYIFHPLYGDRTILGHILGFIFRSGRLAVGGIFYLLFIFFCRDYLRNLAGNTVVYHL